MELKNRYEIVSLVQAVRCNPNGDPDMDNRPRIDEETGKAYMTDVSIKSRIRGYVDGAKHGETDVNGNELNILMRHGESLNRDIAEAVLNGVKDGKVDGFGSLGFLYLPLDNPDTRAFLKMTPDQTGILVRKVFKEYTGFAPAQYFMRLKMERAKDYLLNTDLSCKEITFRLGFDSASYFNKMFRLYEGITPIQFRNA